MSNKGFAEAVVGVRTQTAMLMHGQHGILDAPSVQLVETREVAEANMMPVVRPPHGVFMNCLRDGRTALWQVSSGGALKIPGGDGPSWFQSWKTLIWSI